MFLHLFFTSPLLGIVWLMAILGSLTVHEFAHGFVARLRGDKTAEYEGRLTLNPLKHIDPMGFVLMLVFGFGWAKPVPFNPHNMQDPKWDSVRVGLAGPLSNLILAAGAGALFQGLIGAGVIDSLNLLAVFLFLIVLLNLFLAFFNCIPVHPLDGSKLFFALFDSPRHAHLRQVVGVYGPKVLFFAVLLSAFTSINVFSFLELPAFATCQALLGQSCEVYMTRVF